MINILNQFNVGERVMCINIDRLSSLSHLNFKEGTIKDVSSKANAYIVAFDFSPNDPYFLYPEELIYIGDSND